MAKLSLVKLNMRFGLAVAIKTIACSSCGNRVSKGTPVWAATAPGNTNPVFCCHVCSVSLFHAVDNAARVYNNGVQKLNYYFGTKLKWVDVDGLCAAGHETTEAMYRNYRIDTIAWLVVKDSGFYQRAGDLQREPQPDNLPDGDGGAN